MSSSRCPTRNKLSDIFGGPLSHNTVTGHFSNLTGSLLLVLRFSGFPVYEYVCFLSVWTCVSSCVWICECIISVSHVFSLALLFVWFYSDFIIFVLSFFILLLFLRYSCLFSNKREKGCRSGWEIVTIIYWRKKILKRKEEPLANIGRRVNYEIGGSFLRKLEIELPCGPAIASILSCRHLNTPCYCLLYL